jgi:hypothetical protein
VNQRWKRDCTQRRRRSLHRSCARSVRQTDGLRSFTSPRVVYDRQPTYRLIPRNDRMRRITASRLYVTRAYISVSP